MIKYLFRYPNSKEIEQGAVGKSWHGGGKVVEEIKNHIIKNAKDSSLTSTTQDLKLCFEKYGKYMAWNPYKLEFKEERRPIAVIKFGISNSGCEVVKRKGDCSTVDSILVDMSDPEMFTTVDNEVKRISKDGKGMGDRGRNYSKCDSEVLFYGELAEESFRWLSPLLQDIVLYNPTLQEPLIEILFEKGHEEIERHLQQYVLEKVNDLETLLIFHRCYTDGCSFDALEKLCLAIVDSRSYNAKGTIGMIEKYAELMEKKKSLLSSLAGMLGLNVPDNFQIPEDCSDVTEYRTKVPNEEYSRSFSYPNKLEHWTAFSKSQRRGFRGVHYVTVQAKADAACIISKERGLIPAYLDEEGYYVYATDDSSLYSSWSFSGRGGYRYKISTPNCDPHEIKVVPYTGRGAMLPKYTLEDARGLVRKMWPRYKEDVASMEAF